MFDKNKLNTFLPEIIKNAGDMLLKRSKKYSYVSEKNKFDYVTDVDKNVESFLKQELYKKFPDIYFYGEEGEYNSNLNNLHWVVDPLDGTTNYLHNYPHYCISIALENNKEVLAAFIYQPISKELFHAFKGDGAFINNIRIYVSKKINFIGSLLCTGFPVRRHKDFKKTIDSIESVFYEADGIRRSGSAALDLCFVACGRLDGFWEEKLSRWDIAAGMLLVKEAGGIVKDFNNSDYPQISGDVIASTPDIFNDFYYKITKNYTFGGKNASIKNL